MSDEKKQDYGEPWEADKRTRKEGGSPGWIFARHRPGSAGYIAGGKILYELSDSRGDRMMLPDDENIMRVRDRIVACMNACQGIPTRHLHAAISQHKSILRCIESIETMGMNRSNFYIQGAKRYRVSIQETAIETEEASDGRTPEED